MRFYWTLIIGLFASLYLAKSEVVMAVNFGTTKYHAHFNRDSFRRFHTCLSNFWTYSCTVSLSWRSLRRYIASSTATLYATHDDIDASAYNYYYCTWNRDSYWIHCVRLRLKALAELPSANSQCQYFHLRKRKSLESTDMECVNIVWDSEQHISDINKDSEPLNCGLCETWTTARTITTTTRTTTTTTTSTDSRIKATTFDNMKGDNPSEDNTSLIAGFVVAVIIVLVIAGIIIVIWWRRKRNSKPPSTSHHCVAFTGAISQNYEERHEIHGHVKEHGPSLPNNYVAADFGSMKARKAVVDSHVSPEEAIQRNQAVAVNSRDTDNHTTEYASIDEDVPDTVVSPENVPYTVVSPENVPYNTYTVNRASPVLSTTTPASTTYSRLGELVRNIQNPYDTLQNPDEYSVVESTPADSQTFAGPTTSHSSTQDSKTVHNSTPSSQPTNRNAYDYEEMGVNSMITSIVSYDNEESSTYYASSDNKNGTTASTEPEYANFPVKEYRYEPAKNDYAN